MEVIIHDYMLNGKTLALNDVKAIIGTTIENEVGISISTADETIRLKITEYSQIEIL